MGSLLIVTLLVALASCGKEKPDPWKLPPPGLLERGEPKHLRYTYYPPLAHRVVTFHYFIPATGDITTMPILFAMHGAERNGAAQITNWRNIANQRQIMVFAPQFASELYPSNDYQFAGVSYSGTGWIPKNREDWTISIIEHMFDFIKHQTGNTATQYDIWGHSAGGQFTHRLVFFLSTQGRMRMAVASNPSAWIMPTTEGYGEENFGFPYSLRRTPYTMDDIAIWFSKDMVVHIGTNDTATSREVDASLSMTPGAVAQGPSRYDRAHFFFNFSKDVAEKAGLPFNWRLVEVPNTGHSSSGMITRATVGAADLLYNDRR